jgi:hypothetical protein
VPESEGKREKHLTSPQTLHEYTGAKIQVSYKESMLCVRLSIWYIRTEPITITFFIEIIHNILIPSSEGIHVIIETHIPPIDDEIIRNILTASCDEVCHHNREALFLSDLINAMDIILYLCGKLISRDRRHRENKVDVV